MPFNIKLFLFLVISSLSIINFPVKSQVFPIAAGSDTTFSASAVFGGSTGIVAILGDSFSPNTITAQLVAPPTTLIGNRISLNRYGTFPGPLVKSDGINYLIIWRETDGNVNGQLISQSGNLIGSYFTIASGVDIARPGNLAICFGDNNYFVVFVKQDNYLYGQFVNPAGSLVGGQIKIGNMFSRDISVDFDGNNFLVAWVERIPDRDKDIFGQFVSKTGSLVGQTFQIDGGSGYSDNPTSLSFDGNRYLILYYDGLDSVFNIMAKFITKSGVVEQTLMIADASLFPYFPSLDFDGTNYLITYTQAMNGKSVGRFYNTNGIPVDSEFTIFNPINGKIIVGGCGFGGGYYLIVGSAVDEKFSDGDVYGKFLQPITSVKENKNDLPTRFTLSQNYPNPFNPITKIEYSIPIDDNNSLQEVKLSVYDILGNEIATLVNEKKPAGNYEVIFNGSKFANGVYLYRLQSGAYNEIKKLILLK